MKTNPGTTAFPFPTITIDIDKLLYFSATCMARGFTYDLGAKIPLGKDPATMPHGTPVDCSGYDRAAIFWASGVDIGDGSWHQHEVIKAAGFKASTASAGNLSDGAVRIAFLTPEQGGGIGHVMVIYMGSTVESHGHHGPDRRLWGSQFFMSECAVFVLTPPCAA